MSAGLVAGLLVLAAVVVAPGSTSERLRRQTLRTAPAPACGWVRAAGADAAARARGRLPGGLGARTGPLDVAVVAGDLAVLLRAGLGPGAAWTALLDDARPVGLRPVLVAAAQAAADGDDVSVALTAAADDPRLDPRAATALRTLAATWQVSRRTGAPAADVLQRCARSLRAEADAEDARSAALAAPRATARVLTVLPFAGLGLGVLVGVDPVGVLLGSAAGRVSAAVGAGCTLAGWWWTSRLLAAARRAGDAEPTGAVR